MRASRGGVRRTSPRGCRAGAGAHALLAGAAQGAAARRRRCNTSSARARCRRRRSAARCGGSCDRGARWRAVWRAPTERFSHGALVRGLADGRLTAAPSKPVRRKIWRPTRPRPISSPPRRHPCRARGWIRNRWLLLIIVLVLLALWRASTARGDAARRSPRRRCRLRRRRDPARRGAHSPASAPSGPAVDRSGAAEVASAVRNAPAAPTRSGSWRAIRSSRRNRRAGTQIDHDDGAHVRLGERGAVHPGGDDDARSRRRRHRRGARVPARGVGARASGWLSPSPERLRAPFDLRNARREAHGGRRPAALAFPRACRGRRPLVSSIRRGCCSPSTSSRRWRTRTSTTRCTRSCATCRRSCSLPNLQLIPPNTHHAARDEPAVHRGVPRRR